MRPVLKTNDAVQLSFAEAILKNAGIASVVFDSQMSLTEGSIGILPRRLMVSEEDYDRACGLLRDGLQDGVPGT